MTDGKIGFGSKNNRASPWQIHRHSLENTLLSDFLHEIKKDKTSRSLLAVGFNDKTDVIKCITIQRK